MAVKVRNRAELERLVAFAEARHGYPLNVEIGEWKPARSSEQNAYLFGVCYPLLADAKGYEVADIHEWMCGQHFGWKDETCPKTPHNPQGVRSVPIRTTTRDESGKRSVLTSTQFSEFVAMVQRVGANAGVFIPDPEPSAMRQSKPRQTNSDTTRAAA